MIEEKSASSLTKQSSASKNFTLNYDPENNRKNIYARKLNRPLPGTRD